VNTPDAHSPLDSGAAPQPTPTERDPSPERAQSDGSALPTERPRRGRAFARGLWRWSKRGALAFLVLFLVVRVSLPYVLPGLLARIGRAQGLAIHLGDVRFRFYRGEARLSELDVRPLPAEGADASSVEPLLKVDFLDLDVDMEQLFKGVVHVRRAVLDGVMVRIEREADGRWQLERLLARSAVEASDDTAADEERGGDEVPAGAHEATPIDFSSPVRIDAAHLQHVQLVLVDRTAETPLDTELLIDVRLSDLGAPDREARLHIDARSKELLDRFRVEGTFHGAVRALDATLEVALNGFSPKPLAGMLGAIGLEPVAGEIDARLGFTAHAEALEGSDVAARGSMRIDGVVLRTDLQEALALDSLEVDVPHLAGDRIDVARIALHGVRGAARRRVDGAFEAAGFALLPAAPAGTASAQQTPQPTDTTDTTSDPAATRGTDAAGASAKPLVFTLGELLVEAGALRFRDDTVAPATDIAAELESLRLTGLVRDPAQPDAELVLAVRGRAAGLADALTLDVEARPFAARRTFELRAAAEALHGTLLAAYLAPLGLAPDFAQGSATLALSGAVATDAEGVLTVEVTSEGLVLLPGDGRPAFALGTASLTGLELAADGQTLRIGALTLALERAEATRDELGVVRALGLRTLTAEEREESRTRRRAAATPRGAVPGAAPVTPTEPEAADEAPTPAATPPAPMLRIEVALAKLDAGALRITDHFTPRPVDFVVSELALELRDLALGGDPARTTGDDRATLSARFAAEGVAEALTLDATLTSRPGPLAVALELTVDGAGLVTTKIDPWLAELGVESTLEDGRLQLALRASAAETAEGTRVTAELSEVTFRDGERELLSLAALEVGEVLVGEGFTRVGSVSIRAPRLGARRDAEGGIHALGFRLPPPSAPVATAPGDSPGTDPAHSVPRPPVASRAPVGSEEAPAAAPGAEPPAPARFALGKLTLEDVRLDWVDEWAQLRAVTVPVDVGGEPGALGAAGAGGDPAAAVETALVVSGTLEDVRVGEDGPPARFDVALAVEGALDSLRLAGELDLAGDERSLRAQLTGEELRAGPLAAYLPPSIVVSLVSGRLAGRFDVVEGPAEAGGRRLGVEVSDFTLRDGEVDQPLAGLTRLRLDMPRVDAAARVFEIGELTTEGLVLDVVRTAPSTYEALGVALVLDTPPRVLADAAGVPPSDAPPAAAAPTVEAPGAAEAHTAPAVAAPRTLVVGLSGVASDELPTIDVAKLSLGIDRFGFLDRTVADAVPLALSAHLVLPRPTRILGPEPEGLAPLELHLVGAAPPFVREATLRVVLAAFAPSVHIEAEVDVRGISGPGLASVVPSLAERIDFAGLVDGRISGKLEATLDAQRRGPAAFDLSRGVGAVLELEGLGVRASEGGEVLLGVERVFVDAPRLRPLEGDYAVRTIEVTRPILRARKTGAGLEVLGIVLRDAPPTAEAREAPSEVPVGASADVAAAAPPSAAAAEAGSFVSIGELLVSGVDLRYEDTSVAPAMVIPLTELDVELRGFSTRPGGALTLRAFAESGEVSLPERVPGDGLVAGIVSAAAGAVTGRSNTFRTEQRRLWETLSVSARVTPGPGAPTGHVTLDVEGFELQSLRGHAKASGVEISDGLLETHATVRLLGERGLRIESRTVFTHLFVSEPPGGPISKYLALPAPLDSVLYVLRDDKDQQVIPLSISVPPDGMSTSSIMGIVSVTLGQLIAQAIASSPLRIGSGALGLLGLLREKEAPPLGAPFIVSFQALDGALDERTQRVLADVAADVLRVEGRKLRLVHELGSGDIAAANAAMQLAPASLTDLGQVLFGTREALGAERDSLAAAVRGHLAVGRLAAAEEARLELVEVEERTAETESALDQVFGLMRTGIPLGNTRRSRAVAIVLGEARLSHVKRALVQAGLPAARIELRRPQGGRGTGTGGGRVLVEQR
jgi:hypothetical protein